MTEIRFKNGLMQVNRGDFAGWTNVVDTKLLAELSGVLQTATPKAAQRPKAEQAQTSTTGDTPRARYQARLDERMTQLFDFSVVKAKTPYEKLIDDLFPRSISNPRVGDKSYHAAYVAGHNAGYKTGLADGRESNGRALLVENKALSGSLSAVSAQARELTKKVDFWQAIAARRKERCNYLADEMRKYRDQPAELFIPVVRDTLHASGAKTLRELIAQRDSAHAELTQLRLVNDKLQKAVEDAAGEKAKMAVELAKAQHDCAFVRNEYFAMHDRAEAAEADARIKGEVLTRAQHRGGEMRKLLLSCLAPLGKITPSREGSSLYADIVDFLNRS